MAKKEFPEWAKILYRGVRSAIAAGFAQVVLVPDWQSQPQRTLLIAFVTGFLPSFGMWLRDKVDEWFGWDEKSLVQKVMPF
jgi:hypothetical protein